MAIGSNVPDLDLLTSAFSGDKLEYLVEHRGHTHTIIGALAGAAILYVLSEAFCRWRRWQLAARDHWHIAIAAMLALLLHVAMDFTNNYGVHPFWPFNNSWMYGDSIFIWEPLLWPAAAPLVFLLKTKVARALVGGMLAAAAAACFGSGLVPIGASLLMLALTAAMLFVGYRAPPRTALMAGVSVWIAVTLSFVAAHSLAQRQVAVFAQSHFQDMRVLDYVVTPMPANPVCWDLMLPMTTEDEYVITRGTWSLWPAVLSAAQCPGRELLRDITAPLTPIAGSNSANVDWHGEIRMPRDQWRELVSIDCEAAAFMQFARVPWTLLKEDRRIVGDLRYDREPTLGFAEIELKGATNCAAPQPWLPPRKDVLQPQEQ